MDDRPDDVAALFLDAAAAFQNLIERIEPTADWATPGLGAWDLRALVGHAARAVTTTLDYLGHPAEEATIVSPQDYYAHAARAATGPAAVADRGRRAGEALGEHPAVTIAALVRRCRVALARVDPDAVVTVLGGGIRLRDYLLTRTFELVVHGLDIGAATGAAVRFPQAVLAEAVGLATRIALERGDGQTVLAALTGRRSLPPGFSVTP